MTCANCEALREENERLRRALGERTRAGEIGAVMERFDITATQARLLMRLYAAGGKVIPREMLLAELRRDDVYLRAVIYGLRERLGEDAISTVKGVGHALSIPAVSRVLAAIQPTAIQEVRG